MFVDIMCPDCRSRLLHYRARFFRKDVVYCPAKCGFQEDADVMLDAVGMKWQKAEENLANEKIRGRFKDVHVKINGVAAAIVDGNGATKKAVLDAIFKFHPDRNPKGLDANEVLMVLNKLKGML